MPKIDRTTESVFKRNAETKVEIRIWGREQTKRQNKEKKKSEETVTRRKLMVLFRTQDGNQ